MFEKFSSLQFVIHNVQKVFMILTKYGKALIKFLLKLLSFLIHMWYNQQSFYIWKMGGVAYWRGNTFFAVISAGRWLAGI